MLATESDFVSTRSPAKIADDFGIVPPLIQAVPLVYNIAAAEFAAKQGDAISMMSSQLRIPRNVKVRIASPTATQEFCALS
jgi:hypothetical protein